MPDLVPPPPASTSSPWPPTAELGHYARQGESRRGVHAGRRAPPPPRRRDRATAAGPPQRRRGRGGVGATSDPVIPASHQPRPLPPKRRAVRPRADLVRRKGCGDSRGCLVIGMVSRRGAWPEEGKPVVGKGKNI